MSEGPVMSGAEPFFLRGGDTGILLSHGFTGTTQSMRYLGEALHRLGYTVSAPRLKGHGISPAAMAKSTAGEWVASLEDALAELRPQCKRVFIGGLSMGGTLTLYMAGKHAGVFAGAFPINAVVHVDSPDLAGLAFDRNAPPVIPGGRLRHQGPGDQGARLSRGAGPGGQGAVRADRSDPRIAAADHLSDPDPAVA
jgi:carboxylesterase